MEAAVEIVRHAAIEGNAITAGLQLRNKIPWGMKTLANKYAVNPVLDKLGIKPTSGDVGVADERSDRPTPRDACLLWLTYGPTKAIELAKKYPEMPFKRRQAMVMSELMRC